MHMGLQSVTVGPESVLRALGSNKTSESHTSSWKFRGSELYFLGGPESICRVLESVINDPMNIEGSLKIELRVCWEITGILKFTTIGGYTITQVGGGRVPEVVCVTMGS